MSEERMVDNLQSKMAELERINARLVVSSPRICFWLVADSYIMYTLFMLVLLPLNLRSTIAIILFTKIYQNNV